MLPQARGVMVPSVTRTQTAPAHDAPAPQMAGRAYLRLVLFGAVIGIPAALVAAGFLGFVHELEGWLWKVLPGEPGQEPAYLVLGLPLAGALIVLLARRLLPGDGGHRPLEGLSARPTPLSHAPGVALAAIGTLGFGAVLGPEAPVIALGSVVGVAMARLARLDERATTVLGTAGSFSAISALFGGPLVAGMLMVGARWTWARGSSASCCQAWWPPRSAT